MFRRLELLIGDKIEKLKNSKVILFGVGGVGGYVAEILVRSGVGNLTIVDYDVVDISNKNRQIIALDSTIGKVKVDGMLKFDAETASKNLKRVNVNPQRWYWTITEFDAENAWSIRLANGEFGSRSNKQSKAY